MISIVIPAYNEEKRIGKTLEEYGKFFEEKKAEKEIDHFEIVVVLNACKDNTEKVVKTEMKKFKEIRYLNFERGGKGFAIIEGFKVAKGELIGFVDADMATKPDAYYDLIKNIGKNDGIISSRYVKGSIVKPKQTFKRIAASRVFNFLVRSLFMMSYRDTQCGAKVFKRAAAEKIVKDIGITEWAVDVDMMYIAKRNHLRIREFPTRWQDQAESKLNLKKSSTRMFFSILRLRLAYSPFRFVIRVHDMMPEFIKLHHLLMK